ncbi:MAG: RecQ family ATP-dependent DNA helicase [Myxococcota bacterium]
MDSDRPPQRRRRRGRRRRGARRGDEPRADATPVDQAALRLGIRRLHPEQVRVIEKVLEGEDVLMVVPTGFGKSACYQVPSMLLSKPVVVVSPLLALLKDQHESMLAHGVDCVRLDGTVRGKKRKAAIERIREGGSLLVMTTPETLGSKEVRTLLAEAEVGLVAIDEAHCISEWGHDFRPAYQRLGVQLRALGRPPVLALTATATEKVREMIVASLGMRESAHVVNVSPHRSNLAFEVLSCEGDMRPRALIRLVRRLRRPGIVYCSTRRDVDEVYGMLRKFGVPAHRYQGGMTATERNTEQERFMRSGTRTVMVATSAFGLGIDKRDIRYILHYQAPASLEQYVQEAGRAGRDGKKSNCILLADSEPDRKVHEALLSRSRVRPDQLRRLGRALAAWSDEGRDPTMEGLALSAELGPRAAAALLVTFEEVGLVEREDHDVHIIGERASLEEDAKKLAGRFETLRTQDGRRLDRIAEYASSDACRAVYLRLYFGEDDAQPCELCDVCRGRGDRPDSFFEPLARPATKSPKKRGRTRGRSTRGGRRGKASVKSATAGEGEGAAARKNAEVAEGGARKPGRRRRGRRRRSGRGGANRGGSGAPQSDGPKAPPKTD